jgi:plastocyanin
MARAGSLLVAVSIAALPACGGDDADSPPAPASGEATVVEISATEFALDPDTIAVQAPGTIVLRLENKGSIPHALALDGAGETGTGEVAPGASAELTVDLARGSYTVYCPVGDHRRRGMQAALGVGEDPAATPSPEQEGESDRGGVYGY